MSLKDPLTLPSGLVLENRLVKAAMAENLADAKFDPSKDLQSVYSLWASGGYGALLTGNVAVDARHLGSPRDVALPDDLSPSKRAETLKQWTAWASTVQAKGTPALVQINHPGKQSPRPCRKEQSLAPSPIPLNLGSAPWMRFARWAIFGAPREMTQADIDHVVSRFAETAALAADAGFKGVEIHAAHGYLLSAFLTAKSNQRTDDYGGSAVNRARILREVVAAIRARVPKEFSVAIKLNSADNQSPEGLQESLEQIRFILEGGGVDFLEISGGSYEKPTMMGETPAGNAAPSSRTAAREAFFLDFAAQVRAAFPDLVLMVTGGFRTRTGMQAALADKATDLIGIGRPSVVTPRVPAEVLLNDKIADQDAVVPMKALQVPWLLKVLAGAGAAGGVVTITYQRDIKKLVQLVLGKK